MKSYYIFAKSNDIKLVVSPWKFACRKYVAFAVLCINISCACCKTFFLYTDTQTMAIIIEIIMKIIMEIYFLIIFMQVIGVVKDQIKRVLNEKPESVEKFKVIMYLLDPMSFVELCYILLFTCHNVLVAI